MKRQIITIDESRCTGCGACIPDCPEGALRLIDGKARLVGDLFCDGLGACIGACPEGAIAVEFREAEPYNERIVMLDHIIPKGENTVRAHLAHLEDHEAREMLDQAMEVLHKHNPELGMKLAKEFGNIERDFSGSAAADVQCSGGCPGTLAKSLFGNTEPTASSGNSGWSGSSLEGHDPGTHRQASQGTESTIRTAKAGTVKTGSQVTVDDSGAIPSELRTWPVQMHLINPAVPHYRKSDFLLAADCTAFAMGGFHPEYIRNHTVGIACPKLDSGIDRYRDKLVQLIDDSQIHTLTVAIMEVPCCSGLLKLAVDAVELADRKIPVKLVRIASDGEILRDQWINMQ